MLLLFDVMLDVFPPLGGNMLLLDGAWALGGALIVILIVETGEVAVVLGGALEEGAIF